MRSVSLDELLGNTPKFVAAAASGEAVIITQAGRPIARLLPYDPDHLADHLHEVPAYDPLPLSDFDA